MPHSGPNAASLLARVIHQGRYETALMLRNGEQLVLAVVLPLLALVALTLVDLLDGIGPSRIDAAAPGVLALCVMSTAFTGQGIATGFDRRYGVLTFLSTTPLGRAGLIFGKALAVLAVLGVQLVVVGGTAVALGWRPDPVGCLIALGLLVLGSGAFTSLGLLIAGTVRPEATLAITNLAWVLLAAGGGILIPGSQLPGALASIVAALPSAALGDAMRTALLDGGFAVGDVALLALWAVLASVAASRWFKWT
nr:ABC transporter permease [Zhihengliuella flava]